MAVSPRLLTLALVGLAVLLLVGVLVAWLLLRTPAMTPVPMPSVSAG